MVMAEMTLKSTSPELRGLEFVVDIASQDPRPFNPFLP